MLQIIGAISTACSIISLTFIREIPIWLRHIIGVIGGISFFYLVYDAFRSQQKNEIICKSTAEIKRSMRSLIKTQGKVCIMSRDLSWVDQELEKCIVSKKNSILIFAEKSTELTRRLASQGVKIQFYGKWNFEPKTRFTVIRYNRDDPQVAIAHSQNSVRKGKKIRHRIYETAENGCVQDKWINSLALDMIKLCELVSEGDDNAKTDTTQRIP